MTAAELNLHLTDGTLVHLRPEVHGWLTAVGTTGRDREDIVLACWEAAANALEHPEDGDGIVEVVAEMRDGHVVVVVSDHGAWRERSDERRDRGLGLKLIASLMDRVQIVRTRCGTRLLMYRCLSPRCAAAGPEGGAPRPRAGSPI